MNAINPQFEKSNDGTSVINCAAGAETDFWTRMDKPALSEVDLFREPAVDTKTVLLVEDDEDCRTIRSTMLRHHGYQVLEATDGEAGVRIAREQHPDLILMVSGPAAPEWLVSGGVDPARTGHRKHSARRPDSPCLGRGPREGGCFGLRQLSGEALPAQPRTEGGQAAHWTGNTPRALVGHPPNPGVIVHGRRRGVLPLLSAGQIRPVIDRVYPFAEIADAHRQMEANASFGKIVLVW